MRFLLCTSLVVFQAAAGAAEYRDACQAGQARHRDGRYSEARTEFAAALKLAATAAEKADAQLGLAATYDAEKNYAAARAEFAKVLALDGVPPDRKSQAQYYTGLGYYSERDYATARTELAKVLAQADAPAVWKAQAQMYIGHCWCRESENKLAEARKAQAEALIAYGKVTDIPGVSPGPRTDAQMSTARVLLAMKCYDDARTELRRVLDAKDLPPATLARAQVALAKSCFTERDFAAARRELAKALSMDGLSAADQADAQLHLGLSFYDAQDYAHAKPELEKVLTLPGADGRSIHEATLRLRLRKLIPGGEKVLTVLFIGASHTQVWRIPQMVEVLAASAPAGAPRLVTGEYLRGGTSIAKFWEEGTAPDTARAQVAGEPWDVVVFECYPFLFGYDECTKYATKFAELARAGKATPILFDAPAFVRTPYPDECQKNHDQNVALARTLGIPVAAAGLAWIRYLGPTPTPEQRLALYSADQVHMSRQGGYLLGCSIYAAITGRSPVGLTRDIPSFAPEGISKEDAAALQEAAWQAFRESNPDVKPVP